ncbi:MAG: hypothetical protein KKB50_02650 [Planctomycetes bacterium]|nr:hypothetical protein [Planctomycetota bacterium]
MRLPVVDDPLRYGGLYVYDFGEWCAVGYTADEIAVLLESPEYRGGKAYKIHRAQPDGRFELRGISCARLASESGMFFYRASAAAARGDWRSLIAAAERKLPPCRAFVHLADRGAEAALQRFVTALIYPAEHDEEIGRWLLDIAYAGGDVVEGGISHVTNYNSDTKTILERKQLWSRAAIPSRSPEQVLAAVRQAVQR